MAIQNFGQPRGNATALNISTPTVLKTTAGTFWNINVNQIGSTEGFLYDANALPLAPGQTAVAGAVYPSPQNIILAITPPAPNQTSGTLFVADVSSAGPFPYFNGLVFVPPADMSASIAYS